MIMIYYVLVKEEEKMNGPCWDESIGCRENNQTYSPHCPIVSLFHPDEACQFHSPWLDPAVVFSFHHVKEGFQPTLKVSVCVHMGESWEKCWRVGIVCRLGFCFSTCVEGWNVFRSRNPGEHGGGPPWWRGHWLAGSQPVLDWYGHGPHWGVTAERQRQESAHSWQPGWAKGHQSGPWFRVSCHAGCQGAEGEKEQDRAECRI